jgi:phosphoribosylglycinamide formyltransferase 1
MVKKNKRIAVLLSNKGTGSNLDAILSAIDCNKIKNGKVVLVVSDKKDAQGLQKARDRNIETFVSDLREYKVSGKSRHEYDKYLGGVLKNKYRIDLVVLAGWMLILSDEFIKYFPDKIINLHPSLLPEMDEEYICFDGGLKLKPIRGEHTNGAVDQAIKNGYPYTGSTVHFITPIVDHGPVIIRSKVKIKPNDTIEFLYKRMKDEEHKILPQAIEWFCEDKLTITKKGRVNIRKK